MAFPLNVLIVEDRPADAELVVHALEQADFAVTWKRVDTEPDYLAGLDENPDVILSDHSLPQYDSIRALRSLKKTGRDIPFLIVSGTINEELAVSLLKEGASDYVLKDRLTRLGPAVAQSLEQQSLRRQRLQAEEDLRAGEARFKALIEHSVDGIVLLDATGAVLYGSPSSASISGYAVDELIGRNVRDFLHPEDIEQMERLLAGVIQSEGKPMDFEGRIRHQDKSWRWVAGTLTNLLAEPRVRAIVGNYRDITAYHEAQEKLRVSLAEKEVLLREVHHRVKNNLQVICSLLQMQGEYANGADPRELLRESQGRVHSMALVHERLYRAGDLSRIDFAEYLRSLSTSLFHTYQMGSRVQLTFDLESAPLNLDAAVPCGLLVNELLTNTLKHAFSEGRTGQVAVSLRQTADGQAVLTVADNGVGLPKQFDIAASATFGFRLIAALVGQLHGTLEIDGQGGTRVRILFPQQIALGSRSGINVANGNDRPRHAV